MASQSLWLDRPRKQFPPLATDAAYDVAVVGGGLTGLLTGLLFARSGLSVVVLEARELAGGTTGHTTAKVSVLQGTKVSRILRHHALRTAREYVEANQEGAAWLRRYCEDHHVPFQARPAYTYATTDEGEARARAELDSARQSGLPVTWTADPELPFRTRGAVRLEDQFQLHPLDLVDALVDELVAEGGVLHEWTRVTGAHHRDSGVDVEAGERRISAGHVVIATNMPILDRGGFFARCRPGRSYATALRSPWAAPGMYLSSDAVIRSVRSVPNVEGEELLLVGGNGHVTGRNPSPGIRLDGLIGWARSMFPVDAVVHSWSAQDQSTISELPYVGRLLPREDRILVATGYDKWGFSNAAAAALTLSKTVLGERADWGAALRSWAPRELESLPEALLFNGAVAVQMADGWLRRFLLTDGQTPEEGEGRITHDGVRPVAECRLAGQLHRVSAVCPHLRGILRWNDAERTWDCPLHGSRFAADGSCLEGPATRDLEPM